MVKQAKTIYEVGLKNGAVVQVAADNRIMALKKAVIEMGVNEANIKEVSVQGGTRKYKYPLARPVDLHSARPVKTKRWTQVAKEEETTPPLSPSGKGVTGLLTTNTTTSDFVPMNGNTCFITGQMDHFEEAKIITEEAEAVYAAKLKAKEDELDELREAFSKSGTSEMKSMLEYAQGMFTDDMRAIIASNQHLRGENVRLKDKMKEGMTITILPGGHAILIYGGRVLELSDLPPAPAGV